MLWVASTFYKQAETLKGIYIYIYINMLFTVCEKFWLWPSWFGAATCGFLVCVKSFGWGLHGLVQPHVGAESNLYGFSAFNPKK
jgi:hypothetical protein